MGSEQGCTVWVHSVVYCVAECVKHYCKAFRAVCVTVCSSAQCCSVCCSVYTAVWARWPACLYRALTRTSHVTHRDGSRHTWRWHTKHTKLQVDRHTDMIPRPVIQSCTWIGLSYKAASSHRYAYPRGQAYRYDTNLPVHRHSKLQVDSHTHPRVQSRGLTAFARRN